MYLKPHFSSFVIYSKWCTVLKTWFYFFKVIKTADLFLKLLHDFSSLGSAMRTVMTKCLIDPQTYQRLTNVDGDSEYSNFMCRSKESYEDALRSLPNLEPPAEFQDCPGKIEKI
jgi:hypothetical protein